MATNTKAKPKPQPATKAQWLVDVLGRVEHAIEIHELGQGVSRTARRLAEKCETMKGLLACAEYLDVDPRWLATGITSRAGAAAAAYLEYHGWSGSSQEQDCAPATLRMLPEPDLGAGRCRYCLSTCGVGNWVDQAATICSACLDPEDPW